MLQGWRAETGQVIPFAPATGRPRPIADLSPTDQRGVILLFTGVRYERMIDLPPVDAEGAAGAELSAADG